MRAASAIAAGLAVAAGGVGGLGGLVSFGLLGGCGESYEATLDSQPIALQRAPMGGGLTEDGALVVTASQPGLIAPTFSMVVDTGWPMTVLEGAVATTATEKAGFDLIDPTPAVVPQPGPAVRATFRGVSLLRQPLAPIGDGSVMPGGVMAGDILRRYSVAMRFGAACPSPSPTPTPSGRCSSMTFWPHLGPDLGFLEDSGYAVIRFSLFGGGETTAQGDPDFLGQRGPLVLPATRIVLRTCAVPDDFSPDQPLVKGCCTDKDAATLATGVDLALLLDTGVGPLVLSQSAWARVRAALTTRMPATSPPAERSDQLLIATWPTPIAAVWSTIPKFVLLDNETGPATDPGPCVELGRSRRIEQVSYQTVNGITPDACTQPCDNDPREPDKAQNSAAYVELSGSIPVAVIADTEPYLQSIRFDVRPEGPEVDGLIGAGALGRSRVEIDYQSSTTRAVFSCEQEAQRSECWAAARCPRLPDATYKHLCFGLPLHGLAATCAPSGC